MSQLTDFDDWSWDSPRIAGEVTNESLISQGLGFLADNVKDLAIAKAYWTGDFGQDPHSTMHGQSYAQGQMLGSIERRQNVNAGQEGVTPAYIDPKVIIGGLLALGLIYFAVRK